MSRTVSWERALLIVGLVCLGYYGLAVLDAAYREQEARASIERALAELHQAADGSTDPHPHRADSNEAANEANEERAEAFIPANAVGLLQIPRLNFSTPVLEGDDQETLRGAAGHLSDTPQPWEQGNSAIAAHRDGIFRPLRHVRVGDELRVQTPRHGELRYRVSDTHIVQPTDLSVLEPKSPQMLTLITCFPFNYVGSAPKRFVVHADRIVE